MFYLDLSCTARALLEPRGLTNFPGQRLVLKFGGPKKQEILQHREQVAQKQAVN